MARLRWLVTVGALALLSALHPAAAQERPRLVVFVVIDQFRAEYLETFAAHWRAGFTTLLAEGAIFRRAQYPYLVTDTCAGHTTISTGTFPHTHGMVADIWWDAERKAQTECTGDREAPAIPYGERKSQMANSARNLLAPTLAERLKQQQPGARVVALSLKTRGAITLAGRAGDPVTWFDDRAGTFVTSRAFADAPVPAVKAFMEHSPWEADLGAEWTLRDAPATYRNRDAGLGERPPAGWGALFPRVLSGQKEGEVDAQFWEQWRRSPFANAYLGRMATFLIDAYQLGRRETTDFLGISFSALDYVGHSFGPDSREVEDTAARLDDVLGALIAYLDASIGRDRYVLALSADHGVAAIPSAGSGTGRLIANDVRDRIEETLRNAWGPRPEGSWIDFNYVGDIYLSPEARARLESEPRTVRAIQSAAADIPGLDRLLYAPALSRMSDAVAHAAELSHRGARSGDFLIVPKRGWIVAARANGDATLHGTPYPYDQRVPIILFGAGVLGGRYDAAATPADIAPTVAALVGIEMPNVEGRVLREALAGAGRTTR